MKNIRILILDDEQQIRHEIHEFLESREFDIYEAESPSAGFAILKIYPIDIIILDIRLPEMSGIDMLQEIRKMNPAIEVIMISGHGDIDSVIQALRLGAVDFFKKPFRLQEILQSIEKTKKYINTVRLFRNKLEETFNHQHDFKKIGAPFIGNSPVILEVQDLVLKVANTSNTSVLITGDSGTGKEIVAHAIHALSQRKDKSFYPVNCSSVPDELFESEFFGYNKGAFTGANQDKPGWFEAANHGTLFLDEIGDLKPQLQSKLLRILEERSVTRLGSTHPIDIDVRLIAATNHDLEMMIAQNLFRNDLYHRLKTFIIHVPPLRERKADIPLFIEHFITHYTKEFNKNIIGIEPSLYEALIKYDYPGNVRELRYMIERALILCEGDELTFDHFDHLRCKIINGYPNDGIRQNGLCLNVLEKNSIEQALRESSWNKSKAARMLSISRQALDRKIEKHGIDLKELACR